PGRRDARASQSGPADRDHPDGARRRVAQRGGRRRRPAVRGTKGTGRMTHPAEIAEKALAAIHAADREEELERIRLEYLGSKGKLVAPDFGALPKEERTIAGQAYNAAKRAITEALEFRAREQAGARLGDLAETEAIDVTF